MYNTIYFIYTVHTYLKVGDNNIIIIRFMSKKTKTFNS